MNKKIDIKLIDKLNKSLTFTFMKTKLIGFKNSLINKKLNNSLIKYNKINTLVPIKEFPHNKQLNNSLIKYTKINTLVPIKEYSHNKQSKRGFLTESNYNDSTSMTVMKLYINIGLVFGYTLTAIYLSRQIGDYLLDQELTPNNLLVTFFDGITMFVLITLFWPPIILFMICGTMDQLKEKN